VRLHLRTIKYQQFFIFLKKACFEPYFIQKLDKKIVINLNLFQQVRKNKNMFNKEAIKLLALSKEETRVIDFIGSIPHSTVTNIALETKIPRTTVHFLLKKMAKRELVERIAVNGHYEWKIFSQTALSQRLRKLLSDFESKTDILGGIEGQGIGVEMYNGKERIKEAYKNILKVGRNERVYVIQGNKSAKRALEKIEREYFFDFHKAFKRKGVIMEGIIGESALDIFKKLTVDELESHADRLIVTHIVPDRFIDFYIDIIMCGNYVFIVNPEEEKVIFIKNNSIVQTFKSLFAFIQDNSQKIDLNAYVKKIIEEKPLNNRYSNESAASSG